MNYPGRISLALTIACVFVLSALASLPGLLRRIDMAHVAIPEQAIRFDLRTLPPMRAKPERRDPPKRLIDAGAPAEGPVKKTDLISSQASQAQDMSDKKGDPTRAAVKQVDEFDQIGTPPTPPPAPQSAAPQSPAEAKPETQKPAPPAETAAPAAAAPPPPSAPEQPQVKRDAGTMVVPAAKPVEPAQKPIENPAEKKTKEKVAKESVAPPPERFQVAAAKPTAPAPPSPATPPVPTQEFRAERGREGGGAEKSGFTSFEANKHALGEYMLKVRDRVEREWRTALHLKYSGVSRTAATIHCVIRPDGSIESVSIQDAGDSLTYAVMCRDAVERAGPFGPFPFDVPEIYRTENLEINWRFSYL